MADPSALTFTSAATPPPRDVPVVTRASPCSGRGYPAAPAEHRRPLSPVSCGYCGSPDHPSEHAELCLRVHEKDGACFHCPSCPRVLSLSCMAHLVASQTTQCGRCEDTLCLSCFDDESRLCKECFWETAATRVRTPDRSPVSVRDSCGYDDEHYDNDYRFLPCGKRHDDIYGIGDEG